MGALLAARSDVAVGCEGPRVVRRVGATLVAWARGPVEIPRDLRYGW